MARYSAHGSETPCQLFLGKQARRQARQGKDLAVVCTQMASRYLGYDDIADFVVHAGRLDKRSGGLPDVGSCLQVYLTPYPELPLSAGFCVLYLSTARS